MDWDGGQTVEERKRSESVDLPFVLAGLDATDSTTRREAVRTVRDGVESEPGTYVPTVPKLRELLREPEFELRKAVAFSLAELAVEAPSDVAPSADALVAVAAENPDTAATGELLRCLAAVAAERPTALADHVPEIVDVTAVRDDEWGIRTLAHISRARPEALEPALELLTETLASAPGDGAVPALSVLGRLARSEAELSSLAFVEHAVDLLECDDGELRRNAIGCLADVAHRRPEAVEPARSQVRAALESEDPKARANAAVTIGRVAATDPSVVEPVRSRLLELLEDDHQYVRANACIALGHGDVAEARDRLSTLATGDPEPTVRDRAAWACGELS
ncbi:HEAT repeat domain-containing protein [Natronococcus sp. A-GB1]|uniref:HEAT repeat domain-containing protein n=1 Tax=Natronococcus sp. A-GB1 TaxID=3037648 RepID=UPI00241E0259|nr:HEAT repeat domain-containing protein [Natronococcus sp. A-GB1]MDG5759621.1 HEAT repeat domain-containing protein [Natronococcus sp. A-GB1]